MSLLKYKTFVPCYVTFWITQMKNTKAHTYYCINPAWCKMVINTGSPASDESHWSAAPDWGSSRRAGHVPWPRQNPRLSPGSQVDAEPGGWPRLLALFCRQGSGHPRDLAVSAVSTGERLCWEDVASPGGTGRREPRASRSQAARWGRSAGTLGAARP